MQPDDYRVKVHKVVVMIMLIIFVIITKVKNVYSRVNIQSDTEAKLTLYISTGM